MHKDETSDDAAVDDGLTLDPERPPVRGRGKWIALGVAGLLVAAVAVFLILFQWNWLRGPISTYASAKAGRPIEIQGDLDVDLWRWAPVVRADRVRIGNPRWAGPGDTARLGRLTVSFRAMPLLGGKVELPRLELDRPDLDLFRDAKGRGNWSANPDKPGNAKLPPIGRFLIRDGKLRYRDESRGLRIEASLSSREDAGGGAAAFTLDGKGSINREQFLMKVAGGPLLNIDQRRPYPFKADVVAGATHIIADGRVLRPFDLAAIDTRLTVTGQDLSDLYGLTGAALPNTPPYRISTSLKRRNKIYEFNNLAGRIGDSDVSGQLTMNGEGERPRLTGDLTSRSLDFDDLSTLLGAPPATGRGETASTQQVAAAGAQSGRLMPDATLNVTKIRAMDADVRFRAASIRSPWPIRAGSVRARLDNGLLRLDPLVFDFTQGRAQGSVTLNARSSTPVTSVDIKASGLAVQQFVPPVRGSVPISGPLYVRVKLTGAGNSVRRAAANANGAFSVAVARGEMRKAFAELLGVNVVPGLIQLLNKSQGRTELRCAVAHFQARNGVLTADRLVIDTDIVRVDGTGTLSLDNETLDLTLKGKPKKFRIGRLMVPIRVSGPVTSPKVSAKFSGAAGQAGVAVALGAVLTPFAAVLPFIDPGLAKDANCSGLAG